MENDIRQKRQKTYKKITSILKLALLIAIIVAIPLYIYFFHHDLIEDFSSIRDVENWLLQYKAKSALIYIGAQIMQIIICIVPGQALQVAAGYLYGFWLAFALSMIGAFLGSVAVFYIAQFLGQDAVHFLFGERKITEMLDKLNSKKGMVLVFIIFLIPGIPKDLCTYAAGISNMHIRPFLILSLIGRAPGMMCSIAIGKQLMQGNYHYAIIIAAIVVVIFIIGFIFKNKIFDLVDKAYDKLVNM
ncbi:MAG: TVP38/TMEM64 family protein [Firmicutes bacterium]|nr:TVP38/TMEM64 family protein [Bacillota bacterium]